jgi:hypothetical protein
LKAYHLKIRAIRCIICFWILALLFTTCDQTSYRFDYAEPETMGYSSDKLDTLASHLKQSGSSSMLLLAEEELIFEWGDTKQRHVIHSIRKCLLNSLIGIAVRDGIMDATLTLSKLEIGDIEPGLSENELDAQIADLLKYRSGVYHHAAGVSEGMLRGMPERDSYLPGEYYYYNNWDYKGRFTSIDAEAIDAEIPRTDGFYQYEPSKSRYPAYHFRLSARDLALYGQLYQNGRGNNWCRNRGSRPAPRPIPSTIPGMASATVCSGMS